MPFDVDEPVQPLPRRAVVAHMFHADLAEEFAGYFAAIPGSVDVYMSTDTAEKAAMLERAFSRWSAGAVDIRLVPNVGRDMAPKFVTFADIYARYDAVLCVHSKKSDYLSGGGDNWRATLLDTLCGSTATVNSILRILSPDTGVGLAFPEHYPAIVDRLSWGGNRATAGTLSTRAGIALDRARGLEFVSGSMFWARPAALAPLLSLGLDYQDFPAEAGQLDATTAHALERLLLLSAETAGFDWIKVADPRWYPDRPDLIRVEDDAALPAALAQVRTRLL